MERVKAVLRPVWREITGYTVSLFGWFFHLLPASCEEWTRFFAMMIAAITLFGITLPKAWDLQKKRWGKK